MPRLPRRRSDPQELAAVLHRLERLRIGGDAPGWLPHQPIGEPGARAEAIAEQSPDFGVRQAGDERTSDAAGTAAPAARPSGPTSRPKAVQRLPAALRETVLDPQRRGVALLGALALIGALAGAWYFTAARPAPSPVQNHPPPQATSPAVRAPQASAVPGGPRIDGAALGSGWPATAQGASGAPAAAAPIVVDVVGKVAAPGVVELPSGARIRDAIEAAGGALPGTDLTALDLASRLSDGQEIFVGIPLPVGTAAQAAGGVVGGDGAGVGSSTGGGSSASTVVDLNAATAADLETLPGVGPVLAQHIVDWRNQHGRFTAVTQLQQVTGIGPSKYAALAGRVRV
jgi:competence protein ComEA